ncbi:MAG: DUF4438 domain-containing protein [Armatimonadetes bacterium]|jgi:hypothetical protein|nr:DUF4438 domain-containing protein [Armatimonadota bacterium]MDI9584423.1 DUF4438 domain-containing protein [Acidobacteriota bacterium]
MLRTNEDRLVEVAVVGEPSHPTSPGAWRVTPSGEPLMLPGTGGICTNVRVGDPVLGFECDHLEPAVSLKNPDANKNNGLNLYACVGNEAVVLDGPAEGEKGVVTGKHGGIEHVFIDFPEAVLRKLRYGNKIQVWGRGMGLKLLDAPEVSVNNLDPRMLKKMKVKVKDGRLQVKVAKSIPACIMGSGLGRDNVARGDYDVQLSDPAVVAEYGLADLRLGDIVAILDADNTYGRIYKTGAITVGIVVHGGCVTAGHGPGVTTLFTSTSGAIDVTTDAKANIATILGLRDLP